MDPPVYWPSSLSADREGVVLHRPQSHEPAMRGSPVASPGCSRVFLLPSDPHSVKNENLEAHSKLSSVGAGLVDQSRVRRQLPPPRS